MSIDVSTDQQRNLSEEDIVPGKSFTSAGSPDCLVLGVQEIIFWKGSDIETLIMGPTCNRITTKGERLKVLPNAKNAKDRCRIQVGDKEIFQILKTNIASIRVLCNA